MKKDLKNKRLCAHDGDVTEAMGRQACIGAAVEFRARAGIGFAHD
jgi:hypothetical protein